LRYALPRPYNFTVMSAQTIGRKSKELLIITLLLNLAAIGWYGFLFWKIKEKNEHISDLSNKIEAEVSAEQAIHDKKALVEDTAALRGKLLSFILGSREAVSFIEFLEKTGANIGVRTSVESVSAREHPELSGMEELRLKLRSTGSWPAVVRFLGLMELLPYEADVDQIVMSRAEFEGGDLWRADFTLAVLKEK